jgi:OmpA-OmpF porin, OOP family
MGIRRTTTVIALCAGLLSGCATMQTDPLATADPKAKPFFCALAGGAIGGVGTGVVIGAGAIATAGGAAVAAALGYIACVEEEKVAVAPPREEPMDFPIVHHEDPTPPPPPAPPVEVTLGVISGIHFDFDKSVLKPAADPILREVVRKMQAEPSLRARIEGHTDNIGTDAYNMGLGMRRANAVRDALVSRGIAAHRLETVSKGEREPVADNRTREGRAENRRVVIIGVNG